MGTHSSTPPLPVKHHRNFGVVRRMSGPGEKGCKDKHQLATHMLLPPCAAFKCLGALGCTYLCMLCSGVRSFIACTFAYDDGATLIEVAKPGRETQRFVETPGSL